MRLIEGVLSKANKRSISTIRYDTRVTNDKIVSLDISWKDHIDEKIEILSPDVFDNLSELTKIILKSNEIENIPDKLFSFCYKLESLDFRMNRLKNLNLNFLKNIPNVKRLMLSDNGVKSLVFDDVPIMKEVKTLDLEDHNLENISNEFLNLFPNLSTLDLSRKWNKDESSFRINEVDFSLIPHLEQLYRSECGINDLREDLFEPLGNLKILDLQDN